MEPRSQSRVLSLRQNAPKAYRVPSDWRERPEEFVYIGRAHRALNLPASLLANPYAIEKGRDRDTALVLYENWLEERIAQSLWIRRSVLDLAGKALVCWCAPQPCHGDILARASQQLWKEKAELEQTPVVSGGVPATPLTNPQYLRDLKRQYQAYMVTQCEVAREKAKKIKDERTFVLWSRKVMRPVLRLTFEEWLRKRESK